MSLNANPEVCSCFRRVVLALFLAAASQPAAASPNDGVLCERPGTKVEERISACTWLIEMGVDQTNLPDMYLNRGIAIIRGGFCDRNLRFH